MESPLSLEPEPGGQGISQLWPHSRGPSTLVSPRPTPAFGGQARGPAVHRSLGPHPPTTDGPFLSWALALSFFFKLSLNYTSPFIKRCVQLN